MTEKREGDAFERARATSTPEALQPDTPGSEAEGREARRLGQAPPRPHGEAYRQARKGSDGPPPSGLTDGAFGMAGEESREDKSRSTPRR